MDDILDVEGATADLGKTAGKDAAAGKPTYPALFGLERSQALAVEAFAAALDALDGPGMRSSRLEDIARWVVGERTEVSADCESEAQSAHAGCTRLHALADRLAVQGAARRDSAAGP